MRYSGHESFACRYAWLPKAYRALQTNPLALADDTEAMVELGVGKNMVKSIRFWVEIMGVASPEGNRAFGLTEFGRAVFSDSGFDPFLEDTRTLWLLHWNIATRIQDPLFAWNVLINRRVYPEFTRSEALDALVRESQRINVVHSEATLGQHLDVFLHTYVGSGSKSSPFEDTLDCPLAQLRFIETVGFRQTASLGKHEAVYAFNYDTKPEISTQLFEYCLDDYWSQRYTDEATLTYHEIANTSGSVGQVLKISEIDMRRRLEEYSSPNLSTSFQYQPSAIQGLLTRRLSPRQGFLAEVYARESTDD